MLKCRQFPETADISTYEIREKKTELWSKKGGRFPETADISTYENREKKAELWS